MTKPKPYHGNYTASQYAIVKGQMLRRHLDNLSSSTIEEIVRYVAKHNWPGEREKCYLAAAQFEESSREATFKMLRRYDEAQKLFDETTHEDGYIRTYDAVPGVPQATWELAPLPVKLSLVSSD